MLFSILSKNRLFGDIKKEIQKDETGTALKSYILAKQGCARKAVPSQIS